MFRRRRQGQQDSEPQPVEGRDAAPAEGAGLDPEPEADWDQSDEDWEPEEEDWEAEPDAEDWEPDETDRLSSSEPGEVGQRSASGRTSDRADLGDPMTWTRMRDSQAAEPAMSRSAGPWDSADEYPEADRIDFGSLLVPAREDYDVQVFFSEQEGISIAVVHSDSGLQLQPFAAPRSAGLWGEVLPEIAAEVAKAGGTSYEQDGPFGREIVATVVPQGAEGQGIPPQPLRFLGADGPRWFLRGLISGPAATDRALARPFEEIFAAVVVVRGDHAEPPRKPLEIRLPDEARQVLEEQQAAAESQNGFNPFERGPEITETN